MEAMTLEPVTVYAENGHQVTLRAGRIVTVAIMGTDTARIAWRSKASDIAYFGKASLDALDPIAAA